MATEVKQGIHGGGPKPRGGYANTKAPEHKPRRGIRQARKPLEERIAGYEASWQTVKKSFSKR